LPWLPFFSAGEIGVGVVAGLAVLCADDAALPFFDVGSRMILVVMGALGIDEGVLNGRAGGSGVRLMGSPTSSPPAMSATRFILAIQNISLWKAHFAVLSPRRRRFYMSATGFNKLMVR
jgi:hypothetical protein